MPEKAEIDEKSEIDDQTPSQLTQSYYNKNTAITDKRYDSFDNRHQHEFFLVQARL